MPGIRALLLAGFMLATVSACAHQPTSAPQGASPSGSADMSNAGEDISSAVVINAPNEMSGIQAEDMWIRTHLPGYRKVGQSLLNPNGKIYDRIDVRAADGREKSIYFDIGGFFGKM